nr:hypothetical protein [Bacillus pumilus]
MEEIRRHFHWKTENGREATAGLPFHTISSNFNHRLKKSAMLIKKTSSPQLYGGSLELDFLKIMTSLLEQKLIDQAELTEHKRIRLIGVSKQAAQIVKKHWPIMAKEKRRLSHVLTCDCSHDPAVTALVMEFERQVEDTLLPAVTSIHVAKLFLHV